MDGTDREIRRAIVRRARSASSVDVDAALDAFLGWLRHVRIERHSAPTAEAVDAELPAILLALRHRNDLEGVVSAMHARPNGVISSNEVHWGPALVTRTGLRIATPLAFLEHRSSLPDAGIALE